MWWIGFDTHSMLQTKITNGVFLVLFANTGMLLTTANANFKEISPFLGKYFKGDYYDYSPDWYKNIGEILVTTMLLNAFMPIIFELLIIL